MTAPSSRYVHARQRRVFGRTRTEWATYAILTAGGITWLLWCVVPFIRGL